ncbi:MAG: hypothetical protein JXB38_18990 [Anaerolineales bacterium]|nr:hypothetical protein [Anaerolineales bacterium]
MNASANLIQQVYVHALKLYPRAFREEYAEELCTVFNLVTERAAQTGVLGLVKVAFRELRDLPFAIIAAYVRERRRMQMQNRLDRWFTHEPGSWQEILLAALPFLLLMGFPGILTVFSLDKIIPAVIGLGLLGLIVVILATLGIIGLFVELPRWALPYAGMPLALVAFVFMFALGMRTLFFGDSGAPWALRMSGFLAIFLIVVLGLTLLCVWLSKLLPLTRPFYERVKADWSLLSFTMYGGALVFIAGMYEDIVGAGWHLLLTLIPLVLGIWVYLRETRMSRRLWTLVLSVTAAMGIALAANLQLMDWVSPTALQIGPLALNRAVLSVILTWLTCETMILAPLLLRFTTPPRRPILAES